MLSICVQVLASQDTNSSTPALLTEMEMRSSASSSLCLTSCRGPCCAGGCRGADVRGRRAASGSRHFSCFHLASSLRMLLRPSPKQHPPLLFLSVFCAPGATDDQTSAQAKRGRGLTRQGLSPQSATLPPSPSSSHIRLSLSSLAIKVV